MNPSTSEAIIAYVAIIGLGVTIGGWFVTGIVRDIINNDFKHVLKEISDGVTDLKIRVTKLEVLHEKVHDPSD